MSRRSRKKDKRVTSLPDDYLGYSRSRGRSVAGRVLTIKTFLPRSVAQRARREIYPYPYPNQVRKRGRALRVPLRATVARFVPTKVRIRIPLRLPLARGSYVSVRNGILTIHSKNQLRRMQDAQEFNRRRYSEYKGHKRKASHGQLDSRGSQRFGAVAHAYQRGGTIDEIANSALVARALSQAWR